MFCCECWVQKSDCGVSEFIFAWLAKLSNTGISFTLSARGLFYVCVKIGEFERRSRDNEAQRAKKKINLWSLEYTRHFYAIYGRISHPRGQHQYRVVCLLPFKISDNDA